MGAKCPYVLEPYRKRPHRPCGLKHTPTQLTPGYKAAEIIAGDAWISLRFRAAAAGPGAAHGGEQSASGKRIDTFFSVDSHGHHGVIWARNVHMCELSSGREW